MVKNKLTGKSTTLPKAKATTSAPCDVAKPYRPSKEDQDRERRWKAEDGLRTLQSADKVKSDPRLMKDVQALAKEQMGTLAKVAKGK